MVVVFTVLFASRISHTDNKLLVLLRNMEMKIVQHLCKILFNSSL